MKLTQNWKVLFTVAGVGLLLYLLWFFRSIIGYALVAVVISYMGDPLMHLLKRLRIGRRVLPPWLRAALTMAIFFGVLMLLVRLFTPLVIKEAEILSAIDTAAVSREIEAQLAQLSDTFSSLNSRFDASGFTEYLVSSSRDLLNFSWLESCF